MARPNQIAALYLSLVFVAGGAFGFAANEFYSTKIAEAKAPGKVTTAHEYRLKLIQDLDRDLALDDDQVSEIMLILDDVGERYHAVRDAMEPEFEAIRQERADRISAVLTPDQREVYGKIVEERKRRREEKKRKHREESH